MLADSLSPSAIGFLVFVLLLLAGVGAIPLAAGLLRLWLPSGRREPQPVEPVRFGASQRTQRSPRHAILLHRSLLTTAFIVLIAILLVPCLVALRALGVEGLQVAIALALPTLLVTLHARRRSMGS